MKIGKAKRTVKRPDAIPVKLPKKPAPIPAPDIFKSPVSIPQPCLSHRQGTESRTK